MPDHIVHMIGNAHLDPVWLWHWERGVDEALATCRAACDLLDETPELIFTRGEAWVYEQVRQLDPALFARIRGHIAGGRWEVVGGWWVQPDVNLPTEAALRHSMRLGREWFRQHLDLDDVPVAFNVDSFGHGAYLPRLLRGNGQPWYVMMRPMQNEKALPASLFRWQSPDGAEVLCYRIPGAYQHAGPDLTRLVDTVLAAAPADATQSMCFYGVGNHGGGPTRALVKWILENRDYAPGVQLRFSSPGRYFAALPPATSDLPLVVGELQHHAIGCYSVNAPLKRAIRAAELAADALPRLLHGTDPVTSGTEIANLDDAWKTICFNQFHDILPGSSIPGATIAALAQVGGAASQVAEQRYCILRRNPSVLACGLIGHRIHAIHPGTGEWDGLASLELWTDWKVWNHHLVDAAGSVIPHQLIQPLSLVLEPGLRIPHLVFPLHLQPGAHLALGVRPGVPLAPPTPPSMWDGVTLANDQVHIAFGPEGVDGVSFIAITDDSDTWSHARTCHEGPELGRAVFGAPVLLEDGPLLARVVLSGELHGMAVRLFAELHRHSPALRLTLEINLTVPQVVVKASIATAATTRREDRVAGGWHARALDGYEYPCHHAIRVDGSDHALGVVFPDSFAADATAEMIRITLLRNSFPALHNCAEASLDVRPGLRQRFGTDDGPHSLGLQIVRGPAATIATLDALVDAAQLPPVLWDDYQTGGDRLARFDA